MNQGDVIRVPFPFQASGSDEFTQYGDHWRPGCSKQERDWEAGVPSRYYVDGWGEMVLVIVSEHTPPGRMKRVFYTRKWVDPDGKEFGKDTLYVKSVGEFTKLCKGHRYAKKPEPQSQPEQDYFSDFRPLEIDL